MGKLFEGFKILFTDFDHILEKKGKTIQSWILFKEIWYTLNFYGQEKSLHFSSGSVG